MSGCVFVYISACDFTLRTPWVTVLALCRSRSVCETMCIYVLREDLAMAFLCLPLAMPPLPATSGLSLNPVTPTFLGVQRHGGTQSEPEVGHGDWAKFSLSAGK